MRDTILRELQKGHVEDEGYTEGELWEGKYYRKKIADNDKILVVASANVAVEAVMLNAIEPGRKDSENRRSILRSQIRKLLS